MEYWITQTINEYGYFGVFFLIMIENIFPPIPSEVILTFGGFLSTFSNVTKLGVIIAATIGSVVGAMILYSVGTLVDARRLEKFVDRWGKYLRLNRRDIQKAEDWFEKHGPWAVLYCRLIPLARSLISLPAGMSNMNFALFILLTTIGSAIWNSILVYLGFAVAEKWEVVVSYMAIYSTIVYAVLILGVIIAVVWYIRFRRKRR